MATPNKPEPPKPSKGDADTRSQNEKTADPHDHSHGGVKPQQEGPNPPAANWDGTFRGSEDGPRGYGDTTERPYDFDPNYNPQVPQERVKTVGEEQMERSQDIERMGVDKWKDSQDTRNADHQQRQRQVPGVTNMDRAE